MKELKNKRFFLFFETIPNRKDKRNKKSWRQKASGLQDIKVNQVKVKKLFICKERMYQ